MALTIEKIRIPCANVFGCSAVPDILDRDNLQSETEFNLSEYDEIYEAYGQRNTAYPYRQQDVYERQLFLRNMDSAVLENHLIRAEFLPELGGRLWRLYDKVHGRELIYTNDCIRPSNLGVRNARFSGGVEWNCGSLGHGPYTMDRIFASHLTCDGTDVLRLYAYERMRQVVYQMDFWLDEKVPALNCHMCIRNPNAQVVPMSWWSSIASPLYPEGRILTPAHGAFTCHEGSVRKVDIPSPEPGVDVSHYETISHSRDFFFIKDPGAENWIAHVDGEGRGLLHSSGSRLQSRGLSVWGQKPGGRHWQQFLTETGEGYLELQAGLGKTRYGCLPMAPHTVWEWSERYEALDLTEQQKTMEFWEASQSLDETLKLRNPIEKLDEFGHRILKLPSEVLFRGTPDGELQNRLLEKHGLPPVSTYLDFSTGDRTLEPWKNFLETGILEPPEKGKVPAWDPYGKLWLEELEAATENREARNWYSFYCLGLLYKEAGRADLARRAIQKSLTLEETPWGDYVMAVLEYEAGRKKQACQHLTAGLSLCRGELSYIKAALCLLLRCENWRLLMREIQLLPGRYQQCSRVKLYTAFALVHLGRPQQAAQILKEGLVLEDIGKAEKSLSTLWRMLQGPEAEIPFQYDFDAR